LYKDGGGSSGYISRSPILVGDVGKNTNISMIDNIKSQISMPIIKKRPSIEYI
jgi:hypothetical protein